VTSGPSSTGGAPVTPGNPPTPNQQLTYGDPTPGPNSGPTYQNSQLTQSNNQAQAIARREERSPDRRPPVDISGELHPRSRLDVVADHIVTTAWLLGI
jgi:hypothetical protein